MSRRFKDNKDKAILLRNSFQWLYMVIWLLFLFVFMFGVIFRVVSFKVTRESGSTINISVIVSQLDRSLNVGDEVAAFSGKSNFVGEIAAFAGDEITLGTGKSSLVDCLVYKKQGFFSLDELGEVIKDKKVPENCVLVLRDVIPEYGYLRVGEIIEDDHIIGRAECIVYPFNMIGKSVSEMIGI